MAWLGYFTPPVWWHWPPIRANKTFLLRLPIVGALVLLGNVARNTPCSWRPSLGHPSARLGA